VPAEIINESIIKEDGKSLVIPELKAGDAIVKGKFLGYVPEMKWKIEMYVNNPVTGEQEELETPVKEDGSFELKVPLITTMQVLLRINPFYNKYILLSPGKETTVYVDLYQKNCQETGNEALRCPAGKYMYFGGANAEINNQMEDNNIQEGIRRAFLDQVQDSKEILDMSAEQYKTHVIEKMNDAIEQLSQKNLTEKAYEFAVMDIHFTAIYMLMFADSNLESAYRRAHNLNYEDDITGYTKPVFDKAYYSFLKDIPFNNPLSLYNENFGNMVNSCKFLNFNGEKIRIQINVPTEKFFQELIDSEILSPEETEIAKFWQKRTVDNWSDEKQLKYKDETVRVTRELIESGKLKEKNLERAKELLSLCLDPKSDIISVFENREIFIRYLNHYKIFSQEEFNDLIKQEEPETIEEPEYSEEIKESYNGKYNEVWKQFFERSNTQKQMEEIKSYLTDILGTSQGIVFDILTAQFLCSGFEEKIPLTTDKFEDIAQMDNPFYFNYINQKNNELLAQIEKNKDKEGYTIRDIPETEEEKLFPELLKPFTGKVILVDFWATWCGPCRTAMKRFEPVKERLKEKGVVFVYLTDESSPLPAWQNMIPDIPGEHFRLKSSQFSYLKKKFGVNGVPSYLILNKEGEQIYFKVGFEGSEKLEKILSDAL
jgi:thiol-disulfide isomerase/thioredoxin